MATYLFVTRSDYKPEQVTPGEDLWWSCSSTTEHGDSALVYVAGVGLCYEWEARTDAEPHEEWKYICDVRHVRSFDPPITIRELREAIPGAMWAPPHQGFRGYRSIRVPDAVVELIRQLRQPIAP